MCVWCFSVRCATTLLEECMGQMNLVNAMLCAMPLALCLVVLARNAMLGGCLCA